MACQFPDRLSTTTPQASASATPAKATVVLAATPEAFVSTRAISRAVWRAVQAGKLRKLGSRLYTKNLTDPPEVVVRRNLWAIVAGYFPGAVVADRTAFEVGPASDGSVCVVAARGRNIELPGVVLRPRRGAGPIELDRPFMDGLHLSSRARAFLDNMRSSRARGGRVPRTLSRREIEERLDALISLSGEAAANRLRDQVRIAAASLDMHDEAAALDDLIGALLGTRRARLASPAARARRRGRPFDAGRAALFETLHRTLRDYPPRVVPAPPRSPVARKTLAFFEAYFSNFIEGTEFSVEEAVGIVFEGNVPAERPADAHDVAGTWRLVSDDAEMVRTPDSFRNLEALLRSRHRTIMGARPDTRPGEFKSMPNRAGATMFVAPDLVRGTLEQGFGHWRSLETPFQRAVFAMFLVTEVHPFSDGNGRVARVMMNAELAAAGEHRILVPTVFRANYLAALRALSRTGRAEPLVQAMDYAWRWTARVSWHSLDETRRELEECHAFLDSDDAEAEGKRLRMPGGS